MSKRITPADEDYEGIVEYAKYMNMVPIDEDLLWIAKEGYFAPLPAGWREETTEDGQAYYFNTVTGKSSWGHPLDEHYQKLYETEKKKKKAEEARLSQSSPRMLPKIATKPLTAKGGTKNIKGETSGKCSTQTIVEEKSNQNVSESKNGNNQDGLGKSSKQTVLTNLEMNSFRADLSNSDSQVKDREDRSNLQEMHSGGNPTQPNNTHFIEREKEKIIGANKAELLEIQARFEDERDSMKAEWESKIEQEKLVYQERLRKLKKEHEDKLEEESEKLEELVQFRKRENEAMLTQELESLDDTLARKQQEIVKMSQNLETTEEALKAQREVLVQLENEITSKKQLLQELSSEHSTELATYETKREKLMQEIESAERELSMKESKVKDVEANIRKMQNKEDQITEEQIQIRRDEEMLRESKKKLEISCETLEKRESEAKSSISRLDAEIALKEKKIVDLSNEVRNEEKRLEDLLASIENASQKSRDRHVPRNGYGWNDMFDLSDSEDDRKNTAGTFGVERRSSGITEKKRLEMHKSPSCDCLRGSQNRQDDDLRSYSHSQYAAGRRTVNDEPGDSANKMGQKVAWTEKMEKEAAMVEKEWWELKQRRAALRSRQRTLVDERNGWKARGETARLKAEELKRLRRKVAEGVNESSSSDSSLMLDDERMKRLEKEMARDKEWLLSRKLELESESEMLNMEITRLHTQGVELDKKRTKLVGIVEYLGSFGIEISESVMKAIGRCAEREDSADKTRGIFGEEDFEKQETKDNEKTRMLEKRGDLGKGRINKGKRDEVTRITKSTSISKGKTSSTERKTGTAEDGDTVDFEVWVEELERHKCEPEKKKGFDQSSKENRRFDSTRGSSENRRGEKEKKSVLKRMEDENNLLLTFSKVYKHENCTTVEMNFTPPVSGISSRIRLISINSTIHISRKSDNL
ncbi:hypothetical protein BLNAU_6818 [Blattamonas nauphoetae]|uniref:WW domain-containing protein n=1 Tax=Blattamonas nauphoetae TaxID=2049346 RepID=A0ABQ9Y323_9EUKA|nr:hypothetical protein BLNAU_6818 [Blattamonas nauphoetae]